MYSCVMATATCSVYVLRMCVTSPLPPSPPLQRDVTYEEAKQFADENGLWCKTECSYSSINVTVCVIYMYIHVLTQWWSVL